MNLDKFDYLIIMIAMMMLLVVTELDKNNRKDKPELIKSKIEKEINKYESIRI